MFGRKWLRDLNFRPHRYSPGGLAARPVSDCPVSFYIEEPSQDRHFCLEIPRSILARLMGIDGVELQGLPRMGLHGVTRLSWHDASAVARDLDRILTTSIDAELLQYTRALAAAIKPVTQDRSLSLLVAAGE